MILIAVILMPPAATPDFILITTYRINTLLPHQPGILALIIQQQR